MGKYGKKATLRSRPRSREGNFGKHLNAGVPAGVEVAQGEGHVAAHGDDDGPLAAELRDEDGRQEQGGQEHRAIERAERRHPQALLAVQAALRGQGQPGQGPGGQG